ncbi:ectonucleoside triphosphate diphosphohydrolase 4-like isoform X2 [Rhinoraja longicauda]
MQKLRGLVPPLYQLCLYHMARVCFSCLLPASWHFSASPIVITTRQKVALAGAIVAFCLVFLLIFMEYQHWRPQLKDKELERYRTRIEDMEPTDTNDAALNYGVVIDCGSSGSRVFVYFWPRHNGNPHDLLNIRQMKDQNRTPVVKKIKPGVYAWIGINFVLGRFNHIEDNNDTHVAVTVSSNSKIGSVIRKRTVGILDMGGASLQIAYEVASPLVFASLAQEEAAKGLLAEFNLGCDVHHTEHVYRVYVSTFLGYGGNYARHRYKDLIFNNITTVNRLLGQHMGISAERPYLDPCLPLETADTIQGEQTLHLKGVGDFDECCERLKPFLGKGNGTNTSFSGVYQPPIDFQNSEFYGFSEFHYCTEDVLRMGSQYDGVRYAKAAKDYCATKWTTLKERFDRNLFSSHADLNRLKYQCFKSAWVYEVLHSGFDFPADYSNLKTIKLVNDKEIQWTLGAILYKTRFLPLRDLRKDAIKTSHSSWLRVSFVYNHYLFFACFFVVLLAIILYVLRLRRIHKRAQQELQWLQEAEPLTEGT